MKPAHACGKLHLRGFAGAFLDVDPVGLHCDLGEYRPP